MRTKKGIERSRKAHAYLVRISMIAAVVGLLVAVLLIMQVIGGSLNPVFYANNIKLSYFLAVMI